MEKINNFLTSQVLPRTKPSAAAAAFFVQAINARQYKSGFGNECRYIRRLRGLGPNGDEYFSDFGSIGAGGGRDTHVEAELNWKPVDSMT